MNKELEWMVDNIIDIYERVKSGQSKDYIIEYMRYEIEKERLKDEKK